MNRTLKWAIAILIGGFIFLIFSFIPGPAQQGLLAFSFGCLFLPGLIVLLVGLLQLSRRNAEQRAVAAVVQQQQVAEIQQEQEPPQEQPRKRQWTVDE